MHIYSLQVWDWPRACNCQEGEIFLALFYLREFVREEKKRRRRNRDQRTFKEIYHTYILFASKEDGDEEFGEEIYILE